MSYILLGDSIRWNVYILFGGADKIVHYWSCGMHQAFLYCFFFLKHA